MERLGLPDLFELYQQGQWNWDKVIEIGRIAHQDYDGNGTIDTYGISFMSAGLAAQNFSQANGIPLIESRDNNFVTNIDSPAFYRAMNFLSDLVNVYRITTPVSGSSYYYNIGRAFMQLGAQMDWSSHWAYNRTGAYVKSRIVPTPIGPDNSEGKIITTMAPIGWQIPITEKDKEGMARLMYNMVWTRTDPTALKLSDEQNVNDAIKYLDTRMWPGASDDWADILDFWINGRVSSDLISSAKIDYIDSFPDIKTTLDKQLLSQIVTYTPVSQIINSAGPVLNSMLEQYN
jgi:hypothetical protein